MTNVIKIRLYKFCFENYLIYTSSLFSNKFKYIIFLDPNSIV